MPTKCPICGNISLEQRQGEYRFEPPENIPHGTMVIPDAKWEECSACGEQILSLELERALEEERYRRLGLLTPPEIKEIRKRANLTQEEMAQRLGIGEKTYTRWESGKSFQNKSSDNLIRMMNLDPGLFEELEMQRDPGRIRLISEYLDQLEKQKGNNPLAMAAHGGELTRAASEELREKLRKIASLPDKETP